MYFFAKSEKIIRNYKCMIQSRQSSLRTCKVSDFVILSKYLIWHRYSKYLWIFYKVDQLRNHLNNILPSYVTLNATILLCFTLRTSSSMSSFLNPLFLFLLLLSVTIDFFLTFRKQGHKKWATGRKVRNLHPCLLSYQQMTTTVNWI